MYTLLQKINCILFFFASPGITWWLAEAGHQQISMRWWFLKTRHQDAHFCCISFAPSNGLNTYSSHRKCDGWLLDLHTLLKLWFFVHWSSKKTVHGIHIPAAYQNSMHSGREKSVAPASFFFFFQPHFFFAGTYVKCHLISSPTKVKKKKRGSYTTNQLCAISSYMRLSMRCVLNAKHWLCSYFLKLHWDIIDIQ